MLFVLGMNSTLVGGRFLHIPVLRIALLYNVVLASTGVIKSTKSDLVVFGKDEATEDGCHME